MVQQPSEQHLLAGQDIRRVPFVHPVADQLLEGCLLRDILGQQALAEIVVAHGEVVVVRGVAHAVEERGVRDGLVEVVIPW